MKIDRIDTSVIKAVRQDVDKALESVAQKYGLSSLRAGNASYNSNTFTLKLEAILSSESNSKANAETSGRYAKLLGLPEDVVGKEFSANGEKFTVERIDIKKPKFPIIGKRVKDGKMFKFTVDVLKRQM